MALRLGHSEYVVEHMSLSCRKNSLFYIVYLSLQRFVLHIVRPNTVTQSATRGQHSLHYLKANLALGAFLNVFLHVKQRFHPVFIRLKSYCIKQNHNSCDGDRKCLRNCINADR